MSHRPLHLVARARLLWNTSLWSVAPFSQFLRGLTKTPNSELGVFSPSSASRLPRADLRRGMGGRGTGGSQAEDQGQGPKRVSPFVPRYPGNRLGHRAPHHHPHDSAQEAGGGGAAAVLPAGAAGGKGGLASPRGARGGAGATPTYRGGEAAPQGLELAPAQVLAEAAPGRGGGLHAPAVRRSLRGGDRPVGSAASPEPPPSPLPAAPQARPGPPLTSAPQAARWSGKARRRLRTRPHTAPLADMGAPPRPPWAPPCWVPPLPASTTQTSVSSAHTASWLVSVAGVLLCNWSESLSVSRWDLGLAKALHVFGSFPPFLRAIGWG